MEEESSNDMKTKYFYEYGWKISRKQTIWKTLVQKNNMKTDGTKIKSEGVEWIQLL